MNPTEDTISSSRIGILGGVFDPVHLGHIRIAEAALSALRLEQVLFIPAGQPPHKRWTPAPAEHRLRMLQIALGDQPDFSVSDLELRRPDLSFSVHTLEELHRTYPGAEFFFILGLDAFLDLEAWYRPEQVLQLAHLVVAYRPPWHSERAFRSPYVVPDSLLRISPAGQEAPIMIETRSVSGKCIYFLQGPEIELSSSRIRALLASGQSVRGLLPEGVQSYILSNKLYQVSQGG